MARNYKRVTALLLAVLMVLMTVPALPVYAAQSVMPVAEDNLQMNDNQGDGIYLTKRAEPHLDANGNPDGTIDIEISALTTGTVTSSTTVIPADIVLVLDLSGSMEDPFTEDTYEYAYNPVIGEAYEDGFIFTSTYYGFDNTNTHYILVNGEYVQVSRVRADDANAYYYRYGTRNNYTYVYPILENSATPDREYNYDVVQFYTRTTTTISGETKISQLKSAVNHFIDQTLASNEGLSDANKHKISIVKFADNSFYDGSSSTQDVSAAVVGNHTFRQNGDDYNYTQVVSDLTTVNAANAQTLKNAVAGLNPGGATAVDYGLELAHHVLFDDRTAADIAGRHEIVVVFTDGSPTHGSSYSSSVAGDAINEAYHLKSHAVDGTHQSVQIYSISVAPGANASQLGNDETNQFCHYISSNYPYAQYANGTITPGEGSPTAGFYWVPDGSITLDAIFETISSEIGAPSIELKENATVIDAVSSYFTLPSGTTGIKVGTALKTADAWDEVDYSDTSITATVTGDVLSVTGFNFDENYVTTTPRNGNFYGKMLHITINVDPDYDYIDANTSVIAANGGYINTNLGNAQVLNGDKQPVAEVRSPEIKLNKVTYMLDGNVYATYYRLPGSEITVLDKHADSDAYTYTDWTMQTAGVTVDNRQFTMPQSDVVLAATSEAVDYTVSYEYKGTVPSGATDPSTLGSVQNAGDTVTVAAAPSVTGWIFSGWQSVEVAPSQNGEFTMPARNVTFVGSFIPSNSVTYKVEHYLQNTDGTYPTEPTNYHFHNDGTTGTTVNATIINYPGFTHDPTHADAVLSGIVDAENMLILKLFYKRNVHNVTYEFDNDPSTQFDSLLPAPETHLAGETVNVAPVPSIPGYSFVGWATDGADAIIDTATGTFLMPDRNVVLSGLFIPDGDTIYKVEHYLDKDGDGDYNDEAVEKTTSHETQTDTKVFGEPDNFPGYTYDAVYSAPTASGIVAGDDSLVLKLYYNKTPYKVTYVFTGDAPEGGFPMSQLPAEEIKTMGETVDVKAVPVLDGYTFTGWTVTSVTVSDGKFTMPDEDVVLVGFFSRNAANYKISHFFQLTNGEWSDTPTVSYTESSYENVLVSAGYLTVSGFTSYPEHANTLTSGNVKIDNSLELRLYYKRAQNTVKYVYENTVPGASALPETKTEYYGSTVKVAPNATAPGYTFSGWTSEEVTPVGGEFTMPLTDVIFKGSFTANTNTPYKVEYYKQNLDGTYNSTPDDVENKTGVTGQKVIVEHPKQYEGFRYDDDMNALMNVTPFEGIVAGDGSLTIKIYYKRIAYNVYYRYFVVAPDGAPDISVNNRTSVLYGTELEIANKPTLKNYTFNGWHSNQVVIADKFTMPAMDVVIGGYFKENDKLSVSYEYNGNIPTNAPTLPETTYHHPDDKVTVEDEPTLNGYTFSGWVSEQVTPDATTGEFTMPDENVIFKGGFTANSGVAYKVEHYKQNLDGTYPTNPNETENMSGTTGETVTADPNTYEGFTEDTAHADRVVTGTVAADGSLVLRLYYKRNTYTVKYSYTGTVPSGASALPATVTYLYGEEVTVAPGATAPAYNFSGWSSADVTPSGGKFNMPAKNVEFTGYFTLATTKGYIVIDKQLRAPTGFTGSDVFTFNIYSVGSHENHFIKSVTVKAGESVYVEVEAGRYYITEADATVRGYVHSVMSNDADNTIDVAAAGTTNLVVTNIYVKAQLEKDDHFGYIIGYPDGSVRPEDDITRAEIATIFFRMLTDESRAEVWSQKNDFSDVTEDDWFNNAVSTLANAGVLMGYSDGTFRPNAPITRAELVKIATAFYGTSAGKDTHFSDTSDHWANDFIAAARELGIIDGYGDGSFRPNDNVSRAEAMKIINRTLDRVPHKDHLHKDMLVWSDNMDKKKWYYAEVQEATNSHLYMWDDTHEVWVVITAVRDWAALEKKWSNAYSD